MRKDLGLHVWRGLVHGERESVIYVERSSCQHDAAENSRQQRMFADGAREASGCSLTRRYGRKQERRHEEKCGRVVLEGEQAVEDRQASGIVCATPNTQLHQRHARRDQQSEHCKSERGGLGTEHAPGTVGQGRGLRCKHSKPRKRQQCISRRLS